MKSIAKTEELIKKFGSQYAATVHVATKARKLKESSYNVILDSQAVVWAITGEPPENLGESIKKRIQQEEGISQEDRIKAILDSIDEDDIRVAVINSCKLSSRSKQIAFDYNGIKDKGKRTRVRILTKLAFLQ